MAPGTENRVGCAFWLSRGIFPRTAARCRCGEPGAGESDGGQAPAANRAHRVIDHRAAATTVAGIRKRHARYSGFALRTGAESRSMHQVACKRVTRAKASTFSA